MLYHYFKRLFDFISSFLLLLVVSPAFIILMILVRIKLGSPIFFKQERTGRNGRHFQMIKFRTMIDKKDNKGKQLPDDERLTPFGRFLRSKSIDELPELLNIIKGDMAVIGPRPLPSCYDPYYSERERLRFRVRGGLIPPDSIDPNPIISWDKQFEYEVEYANHLTFKSDLKIFLNAFRIVFQRSKTDYGSFIRPTLIEERTIQNEQHFSYCSPCRR